MNSKLTKSQHNEKFKDLLEDQDPKRKSTIYAGIIETQ